MSHDATLPGRILIEPIVVTVGLSVFEESLRQQGTEVIPVRWEPPRELPKDVADLLKDLL